MRQEVPLSSLQAVEGQLQAGAGGVWGEACLGIPVPSFLPTPFQFCQRAVKPLLSEEAPVCHSGLLISGLPLSSLV